MTNDKSIHSLIDDWPHPSRAWRTVLVLTTAYMLAYADRVVLALLVEPIKDDLSLSDTQISLIVGFAFAIFYACLGLPIARYADRANRKNLILVCIAAWSAMTALCGFAKSYAWLFIARIGVATGEAGVLPCSLSIISDSFRPEKRVTAVVVFNMGVIAAATMTYSLGGYLVQPNGPLAQLSDFYGWGIAPWRLLFIALGLCGIPLFFIMLMIKEPARRGRLAKNARSGQFISPTIRETFAYLNENRGMFLSFFGGVALVTLVLDGIIVWLPTFFMRSYGLNFGEAGLAMGLLSAVAGASGLYFSGYLQKRFTRAGYQDVPIRVGILLVTLAIISGLAGFMVPNHGIGITLIGVAVACLAGGNLLPQFTVQLIVPNELRAQVGSIYTLVSNLVGFGLGPTLIALGTDFVFQDEAMLKYSIVLLLIVILPIAFIALFLGRTHYIKTASAADDAIVV